MSDFAIPTLLGLLTVEEVEVLSSLARRQNYADGETIHEEGDLTSGIGVVISGRVKLVKRQSSGNLLLETIVFPGQTYGDSTHFRTNRRTHGAIAEGETVIDHLSPHAFDQLLEYPGILRALYHISTFRLASLIELLDDMRALPIEGRLAKLLGRMIEVEVGACRIDCLQEDLANVLGVSSMTIAKALGVLRNEGLVTTGYRQITVLDVARLRQWGADFPL